MADSRPKILLTGSSGLVGSRLFHLWQDKYQLIPASLEQGIDLLDQPTLLAWAKQHSDADYLVHLAAFTNVAAAEQQRGQKDGLCYQLNVELTQQLAQLSQQYGWRMIYISTDYVFDGRSQEPYTETSQPNPIGWYGQTKYLGEQAVQQETNNWLIVRISYPYRPAFAAKPDWVQKILLQLQQGKLYPMFSDQQITLTWVDDIADGIKVMIDKQINQQIFHLTGSSSHSPYQAARLIAQQFGYDPDQVKSASYQTYLQQHPDKANLWPQYLTISNQKVQQQLSFHPLNLKQGLNRLWQLTQS